MFNKKLLGMILTAILFLLGSHNVAAQGRRMFLGVYDPNGTFSQEKMDMEGYFIPPDPTQLAAVLDNASSKNRTPIVTIEWTCPDQSDPENVLQKMYKGEYDDTVRALAQTIKSYDGIVMIRLFHEMELTGLYCWSRGIPAEFISAYRHFVDVFRKEHVNNAKYVWAPAGNSQAVRYFPGTQYVDLISFTLLGYDQWDIKYSSKHLPRSFKELLMEKYWLLDQFQKPMFIGEFGIARPKDDERKAWLTLALEDLKTGAFPHLVGVMYFNAKNAENSWTNDQPDWSITPDIFWSPTDMPALAK